MRLYTSRRTPHGCSRLCHVHLLPIAQQECLPLTQWQLLQSLLNDLQQLPLLKLQLRLARSRQCSSRTQRIQRIGIGTFIVHRRKDRQQRGPQRTYLLSAQKITYLVLQNALKQCRQLIRRLCRVLFSQLEHGILHHVQRTMLVPQGEHCVFERPPFNISQKCRHFLISSQTRPALR